MDRWVGKVAVVTGAASGMGLATAYALVREGLIVVGIDIKKEKIEEATKNIGGKGKFHGLECDISKEEDVAKAFDWIKEHLGPVHVLVNNAGVIGIDNTIFDVSTDIIHKVFDVNVMGLLYCTRQALKMMKEGDYEAHIVNVSSCAGHPECVPTNMKLHVYPATKNAVTCISETLRKELHGGKIKVSNISPGLVKTNAYDEKDTTWLDQTPSLKPEDIAESIVFAIGTPQRMQVTQLTVRPLQQKMASQ